jgi:hypothetical protein
VRQKARSSAQDTSDLYFQYDPGVFRTASFVLAHQSSLPLSLPQTSHRSHNLYSCSDYGWTRALPITLLPQSASMCMCCQSRPRMRFSQGFSSSWTCERSSVGCHITWPHVSGFLPQLTTARGSSKNLGLSFPPAFPLGFSTHPCLVSCDFISVSCIFCVLYIQYIVPPST